MRKDILLDEDGDLNFHNGDFDIGQSDQQHIEHIIAAQKGEYKNFPFVGFGVINYLKGDTSKSDFKRDLKIQIENDGYSNPKIDLSEGFEKLNIEV
ncbi:hypothetical protein [Riemerella anatipestifer]|uniref:Oxidase n=1 Tax=Riemerella anatipestifer TaxID=34085 RepID=A0A1S7DV32_RIEAN|nr:hypothetical protein [Riemerella anatipestifer]AQY22970.1 hypothetical protein AB406_2030 [Riemerella anatipestifer]MBT0550392.1 hypothetical protein [Riemerella anatipestifer]MBT0556852.1 hypothetical protein [Riemerella anatipestifer]MBT0561158.1 hypothetical protein [Riemerella anatipestifer]MCO7355775.1 hypothetical protein [Riemerella anatipestifer]